MNETKLVNNTYSMNFHENLSHVHVLKSENLITFFTKYASDNMKQKRYNRPGMRRKFT